MKTIEAIKSAVNEIEETIARKQVAFLTAQIAYEAAYAGIAAKIGALEIAIGVIGDEVIGAGGFKKATEAAWLAQYIRAQQDLIALTAGYEAEIDLISKDIGENMNHLNDALDVLNSAKEDRRKEIHDMTEAEIIARVFEGAGVSEFRGLSYAYSDDDIASILSHPGFSMFSRSFQNLAYNSAE